MKASSTKLLCGAIAATLSAAPALSAPPAVLADPPTQTSPPSAAAQPSKTPAHEDWSDRISNEFQQMEQHMDRIFSEATGEMKQSLGWSHGSGFWSAVKLTEDQNDYVVHLAVPDRDSSKVDARIEGGNTLRITAQAEKKEQTTSVEKGATDKSPTTATYELGRYEQLLTLPGPVNAAKMKIERSGSAVTITLPKADQSSSPQHSG
jgi:HSP20 family molecular chaperone IbpA